ncbi:hypothetical protein C9374_009368 [Naegleria lovaniensis]|uniref:NAD-dependent epimerase/dehydratase domain-containing protein n=1 Tax=Naegleria lovaniensis TaxID=51637 RepID=A0AA88KEF0_NAELO|nr:uncharacterized protein C9374_009368 [Naegleria lovaniensis]KAG2377457.1 hypothetical protein C9374_009368 [Naegleria lovaniensis]
MKRTNTRCLLFVKEKVTKQISNGKTVLIASHASASNHAVFIPKYMMNTSFSLFSYHSNANNIDHSDETFRAANEAHATTSGSSTRPEQLQENSGPYVSQLIIGGASGFVGKQLLKHILSPNSQKIKVPFSDQLSKLSHLTILSRKPEETRQVLEQQCPLQSWERKDSIQVQIKDWKDLNPSTTEKQPLFLFKHQVSDVRETFDTHNKKVAAVNLSGASVGDKNWTPEYKKEIISSRVQSTQQLMQHLNTYGDAASVFIGTSAVGYYPSTPDLSPHAPIYTEYNCPQAADNPLGEVTQAVEDTVSHCHVDNIKRRIILRPGAVIGKNGGMLSHMIVPYLGFALPIVFGTGLQPLSCVHISDLSNMYIHALYTNFNNYYQQEKVTAATTTTNGTSSHPPTPESSVVVYNAVMLDMITFQQFVSYLNAKTNLFYLPLIPMSYRLVKLLFGKERAQLLCEGQYVTPTRFIQENFQFSYPNLHSVIDEVVSKQ